MTKEHKHDVVSVRLLPEDRRSLDELQNRVRRERHFVDGLRRCAPGVAPPPDLAAAGAQQPERTRRVGILFGNSADDKESQARNAAFLKVLQERGWTSGRNVQIETHWAAGAASANLQPNYAATRRRETSRRWR